MPNLLSILISNLAERPQQKTFWVKRDGQFMPILVSEMAESIVSMSLGLKSLGVESGDFVAMISHNRPEWVVTDFAVMGVGACLVPIYPTLAAADILFILNDCQAKVVVVDTQDHLDVVQSIRHQCPCLSHVIVMADEAHEGAAGARLFCDIEAVGRAKSDEVRADIRRGWADVEPGQLATIVYTSGTTGYPKGVRLTHRNLMANVEDILQVLPITSSDVVVSFLPLSHVFERTGGYYTVLAAGGRIYYAESIHTVAEDMQLVHPTIVVSVPRLYEKVQAAMMTSATGLKAGILMLACRVGRAYRLSKHPHFWLKLSYQLMDKLVYSTLRHRLGGKLRFFVSGGAPLRQDLAEFFCDLGVLIIEGYGMTETSPVLTCNRPDRYRFGTVGLPLPHVELKLGDQDELLAKGPSMSSGYLNRPDATAQLIDEDGWLHTGDVAKFDADGFVKIVDRIKELIVLSNGKKVAPQPIESQMKTSRLVSQVMVIGDKRNYLTALVVLHMDEVKALPIAAGLVWNDAQEFLNREDVVVALEAIILPTLSSLSRYEQVKKCRFLAEEWSLDAGELTPSLKIKRKVILEKYSKLIDSMYA